MNIDSVNTGTVSPPPARSEMPQGSPRNAVPAASTSTNNERAITTRNEQDQRTDNGQNAPSRDEVEGAVSRLSKFVAPNQSEINFSVDESSGIRVVKIIDRNSNEVIRQMPSEEAVALARALDKLQGLLIKDKA
ncbi:flagellar protein FlaG [Azonexus hydrophilus]|jgi:flagellar protein FlaG|uniref:Flagellar protein FlaG n=1 Tax=Azonexus hydrophilus TaxID=418702 RepID=A0ABZ2XF55_9RHOO|nr:flagellar protein FlaG [Dechloromonas sp.]